MKIGIIGAGKMGYTLGKHFSVCNHPNIQLVGYYSKNIMSAIDAADFTDSEYFDSLEKLVIQSDVLFITVPDDEIKSVSYMIKDCSCISKGKILCHTSGALSSVEIKNIYSDVYTYSVHPIFAVSSKKSSYVDFGNAFITIEGDDEHIETIKEMFVSLGHNVKVISAKDKVKYHSAAVFSSNLVIGLYRMAEDLMKQCGFNEDEANLALKPLFINNAKKLIESSCEEALTGPVERSDVDTIKKHLNILKNEYYDVYKLLSGKLLSVAEIKNYGRDYSDLYKILDLEKDN